MTLELKYDKVSWIEIGYDSTHKVSIDNVVSWADRVVSPDGDLVEVALFINDYSPTGVHHNHKYWEMEMVLDTDYLPDNTAPTAYWGYAQDVQDTAGSQYAIVCDDGNYFIEWLKVYIRESDGTQTCLTYTAEVDNIVWCIGETANINNEIGTRHQTKTFKFICLGERTRTATSVTRSPEDNEEAVKIMRIDNFTLDCLVALEEWETWIDFMTKIDEFNDTTVSLSVDSLEVQNEYVGTAIPCNPGCTPNFYYNGATPRLYIFYEDGAGAIHYRHSRDGVTWTDVDSTANLGLSGFYSVTWDDANVYLLYSDAANIDCWVGTIADVTGTITFGNQYNNVVALAGIMFGPTFDSQGDIWAVFYDGADPTTARGYESDDVGATWVSRLNPGANHELYALADANFDGDVYGLVFDVNNTDVELWTWDRGTTTFAFTAKIDDEDDCDGIICCQDADFNITLLWADVDADEVYLASNRTGAWVVTNTAITGIVDFDMTSDGYYTYLIYADAGGGVIQKCLGATMGATLPVGDTARVGAPHGYTQDGHVGIFFIKTDAGDDLWCLICTPEAIRLVEGVATGDIKTFGVTASGSMIRWGRLEEEALDHADQSWDVLTGADVLIVGGLTANFDLDVEGVPAAITTIKLQPTLTDTGADPLLYSFTLTERDCDTASCTNILRYEDDFVMNITPQFVPNTFQGLDLKQDQKWRVLTIVIDSECNIFDNFISITDENAIIPSDFYVEFVLADGLGTVERWTYSGGDPQVSYVFNRLPGRIDDDVDRDTLEYQILTTCNRVVTHP